jgi:peptidyl-prolyl cis-trans isomerase A (cyclophilin A)
VRRLALAAAAACLAACAGTGEEQAPAPAPAAVPAVEAPAERPAYAPKPLPAQPDAAQLSPETANEKAPETFQVRFDTTKGAFTVQVTRAWAPIGADRFYNLVKRGYYDDVAFFRVLSGFMAQTGIHGDPRASARWRTAGIPDDLRAKSNTRGRVTFATGGPNTRTTQIFFNYSDNSRLDGMGFTPFGEVVDGMETLDALYAGYGEGAPRGPGPDQGRIQAEGNAYLTREFPKLDFIKSARLE